MPLAAWEKLYNELEGAASELGYDPPTDLAKEGYSSQCFQLKWKGQPVLYVGFRDLVKIEEYSSPTHIWVGGFKPIFRALNVLIAHDDPFIPPAFGLVSDNSRHTFVLVPFSALLRTYFDRQQRRMVKVDNPTFALLNREQQYFLETSYGSANIPLREVGTMRPLITILDRARDPTRRISLPNMFD